jgi:hypothetical protein
VPGGRGCNAANYIYQRIYRHPDYGAGLKAGAHDFLTKPAASDDLFPAVERAFARHQASREQQAKLEAIYARIRRLTPRERQVYELIVGGNPTSRSASFGSDRAQHQGPLPQGDGEDAGSNLG